MIVLASETYGSEGSSTQGTWEELIFAKEEKKPLYVIRMCSEFKESAVKMELMKLQMPLWTPNEAMPKKVWTGLVDMLKQVGIINAEKASIEKAVTEEVVFDEAEIERVVADKAENNKRVVIGKLKADRATADKVTAEMTVAERIAAERVAAERALAERVAAAGRVAAESLAAADKAKAESLAAANKVTVVDACSKSYE